MPKKAKRRVVQSAHESRASDNEMRTPLPPKSRPTPQSGRHFSSGTVTIDPPRKKAQGKPEGASVPPSPSEHDFNDFNDFDFSAPADDVPNVGKVIPKRGATKKNTVFVTKKQAKPTKFVAVDDDSEDRREEEGARQKTPMVTNKPRSRGLVERTDSFVLNPHSPLAQSANEATGLAKGLSKRLEARDSSGPLAPPKLAPVRDSSPKTLASAKNLGAPPPANKKTKNPGVLLPLPILPHTVSAVAGSPTRVCVPELELEELKRLEERLSPASKSRLKEFDDFWASLEEPPRVAEAPADDVVVNLPPKPVPARGGSIVPETDPGTSSQSQSQSQPSQSQQPPLPSQQQPPPSPRPTIKSSMKPRSPSKNGISSKSPELPDDYDDYPIDNSPPLFPNRDANNKGYSKSKKLGPIPVVSPSTFHPHLPPSSDRNSGDVDGDVEEEEEEEEVEDTIDQFSPEKKDQANALRRIPIHSRKTRSRTVEVDTGVEARANGDMDLDVDHSELQVKAPAVVHKSSEPSQRVIQSHANVISLSQDSDVIDREIRERGAQLADQARKERRAELGLKPRGENRRNLNHLLEQKDQVRDGAEDHVSPAANFVDATGETNRKSLAMDVNEGDRHLVDDEYDADREYGVTVS
ncbi:hypothetical protein BT96DRAFT_265002 [Gymnopus androsaceus JB14]|uniref:Uncharacterized protein n=1 Tax=Gymnopus androsaceus JB14 TaxID=1447944 RepID=A0A6A4H639_9AGAR|nr:hypothetical protein BT96DRAFT_265002 [Gymnopus androsaceus JB14]